ncbi:putative inorganic phosphate cotransporter [Anthonomus grandis grandis]|uniref:putative inorganic phosphate cotransporter n=1 Tax=Anthonomus grandis grandis TaxID=2921223 RepID=UPI00216569BD|nr:putative inorganic phosphate cotransporter [Anthonomus grandis grandis]
MHKGPIIGIRHVQTLLMFLLLSIGYSMRVNLSVGIVAMTTNDTSPNPDVPTYNWNNTGLVLSSFFMGYITLQVLAGELGKRYGVKWFLVIAMAVNSIGCILTPAMAAWFGVYGVMAIRILQGIFQGFFFPSVHNILGKWAPKEERSTLGNFIFTGVAFGTIIAMPITGLISASWAGWPVAFYVFGASGLVWCLVWLILGSNNPEEHKYITSAEKQYIQTSIGHIEGTVVPPTPWKAIFKSLPVWAIVIANSGQNWGYATLLTHIPNYLNHVAHQDISKNSIMSAAPYLALFILGFMFGPIADTLIAKKILSPTNTRKLMNSIGALCPAIVLTVLGFVPAENVYLIEALLIITVGINAAIWCGFQVNPVDLSPRYSGILMGVSNGSSNIFSIISPSMVDFVISDLSDQKQWRVVFIIAAAAYTASNIFYLIFAQAELQWWDSPEKHQVEEGHNYLPTTRDEEKKS